MPVGFACDEHASQQKEEEARGADGAQVPGPGEGAFGGARRLLRRRIAGRARCNTRRRCARAVAPAAPAARRREARTPKKPARRCARPASPREEQPFLRLLQFVYVPEGGG